MIYSNKRNFSFYLSQNIIVVLITMMSIIIFTRIFSPKEFGIYALAMVFGNVFSSIINFGLHLAYESFYFKLENKIERNILFNQLLYFNIIIFLFFLIPINFFQKDISYLIFNSKDYSVFIIGSYVASNLSYLNSFFLLKTRNKKDGKINSIIKIGIIFFQFLLSLFLIFYLEFKIEGLIYAILISNLIILFYLIIFYTDNKVVFKMEILKKALIFSYPLFPKILMGAANSSYDKFVVKLLVSLGGLGVYDISQRIVNYCNNFLEALQNTFIPDFYRMANEFNVFEKKDLPFFITKYLFIYLFFCLIISFFSFELISIITPKKFHESINLVSILSLSYSLIFFGSAPVLIHLKKTFLISKLSVFSFILNIIIVICFINTFGLIGAVIGILISNLIIELIRFIIVYRLFPLKWDFKKILSIYFLLFFSSIFIIIAREIELYYFFRLSMKIVFIISFLYYGNKNNIIDLRFYYNLVLKKLSN